MRLCMKKTRSLRVRRYASHLIDLNEYLASFTGATMDDSMGVTESNKILLNSMSNRWSKQAYVQSSSSPRWDNLPSGHQQNPLLGLFGKVHVLGSKILF